MRPRLWPILIAGCAGCACLVALGLWQLERMHWKEGLIAAREVRLAVPAVTLAEAVRRAQAGGDVEFLKVAATGAFRHDRELFYLTTSGGAPGFQVLTPLVTVDGTAVLVDRGFVSAEQRDAERRPESQPTGLMTVEGYAGRHARGRGIFTPDNNAAGNIWYWWDVPAMLDMAGVPAGAGAPFILHALPGAGKALPQPGSPNANLPNNHLQYALTWLTLAAALALMTGLFVRQQMREGDDLDSPPGDG